MAAAGIVEETGGIARASSEIPLGCSATSTLSVRGPGRQALHDGPDPTASVVQFNPCGFVLPGYAYDSPSPPQEGTASKLSYCYAK